MSTTLIIGETVEILVGKLAHTYGTVTAVDDTTVSVKPFSEPLSLYYDPSDLRRARATTHLPLEVGDSVLVTNPRSAWDGSVGQLVHIDSKDPILTYKVHLTSDEKIWFGPDEIERFVAPTITKMPPAVKAKRTVVITFELDDDEPAFDTTDHAAIIDAVAEHTDTLGARVIDPADDYVPVA